MKLTGEQVYEILQEFRKGDFVSLHDSNVQGRYLITSTYGIYTITEKLNKLLENEKRIDRLTYIDQGIFLSQMETIREMLTELNTKLDKIQEQLTSLSGENKKESPQKEETPKQLEIMEEKRKSFNKKIINAIKAAKKETQEKSCATCYHFDIICKKDWCGDNYKGWQPKQQEKSCATCGYGEKIEKPRYRCNDPDAYHDPSQGAWCTHWQPKQESR